MPRVIQAGTYKLGPENATLRVKTGRHGPAAKAGHDLVIDVTSWTATLEVGDDPQQTSLALDADAASLRVDKGVGGVQELGDADKSEIEKTIDEQVLRGGAIEFRSTAVAADGGGARLRISGDLELAGSSRAIDFELTVGSDGQIRASVVLKQSDWGIKPYSGLFGALKVDDEVEVVVEAKLS